MKLEAKFSKELTPDLRRETAEKLKAARRESATFNDLKNNLPEDYRQYQNIEDSFESLKKNVWGKIFKTEKYRQAEAMLNESLGEIKQHKIDQIRSDYQKKFNEIMSNCPLTSAEREKYLSTAALERMPLDDYLVLLRRLSGEAFYHVTRYGVRENTFMSTGGGHTAGAGQFIDSFTPLLKDGNINSCTATIISDQTRAKEAINSDFLKEAKASGLSVSEVVDKIISSYGSVNFLDRESAHFSYGRELHGMYGSEDNYKFYFYYPAEYILQNDFFISTRESQLNVGRGYYYNAGGIEQQYNDFEVFNFGQGVPINAGILCISSDIPVDPETGSQYLLENGQPARDEAGGFKKPDNTISSQEYWENYFKLHPELKPSKVVYGSFYSSSYKVDPDLENWARQKNIHRQADTKIDEFKDYRSSSLEALRGIFTDIVTAEFNSKS